MLKKQQFVNIEKFLQNIKKEFNNSSYAKFEYYADGSILLVVDRYDGTKFTQSFNNIEEFIQYIEKN